MNNDTHILHPPASGQLHWSLLIGRRRTLDGVIPAAISCTTHETGSELFTRTIGQHRVTTKMRRPSPATLTERFGPFLFTYTTREHSTEDEQQMELTQHNATFFSQSISPRILKVSATVKQGPKQIDARVFITLGSTATLTYNARLTTTGT